MTASGKGSSRTVEAADGRFDTSVEPYTTGLKCPAGEKGLGFPLLINQAGRLRRLADGFIRLPALASRPFRFCHAEAFSEGGWATEGRGQGSTVFGSNRFLSISEL
jgi:hypothetical protein